ncbi:single-stranded DNA-binding protein [Candidatus Saganbacteria bacterium]|nr:single-stranded DNA-binding protein [Candidatus Saganbacteria bacterium]
MASLNRIIILGDILSDPETRFSVEGVPMVKFAMPISSGFNQANNQIEVVCFGKLAETNSQLVRKNLNVLVEGRIQIRSFDDQGGTKKWVTEVVATSLKILGAQGKPEQPAKLAVQAVEEAFGEEEVEELPPDDLPF